MWRLTSFSKDNFANFSNIRLKITGTEKDSGKQDCSSYRFALDL